MDNTFSLFATPWWVNLFILIPFVVFYLWRREGLLLAKNTLIISAVFGIAFGVVEAIVVVYLRKILGILQEFGTAVPDVITMYHQVDIPGALPPSVLFVEVVRETATIIMLASIAVLAVRSMRGRLAVFLWTFAVWDISYYIGLWAMIRWPASLFNLDVLFLIPIPWFSQVWYPILISVLLLAAVIASRKNVVQI